MDELTLEGIVERGILGVEESPEAYYIWPRTGTIYVSNVYRLDKATGRISYEVVTSTIEDYPDFMDRTNEVPIEDLLNR